MSKKFKHKKTKNEAELTSDGMYYKLGIFNLPICIVENSNDWEEIIEVPEYVRCVSVNDRELYGNYIYFTKNKIYPVKEQAIFGKMGKVENDRGDECCFAKEQLDGTVKTNLWATWFRPSTKEAYDKQQRKPIFRTEDGVDMFDGDRYFCIELPSYRIIPAIAVSTTPIISFSTEVRAKDYIFNNKPCLSLNEALTMSEQAWYNLAKQRTNNLK